MKWRRQFLLMPFRGVSHLQLVREGTYESTYYQQKVTLLLKLLN